MHAYLADEVHAVVSSLQVPGQSGIPPVWNSTSLELRWPEIPYMWNSVNVKVQTNGIPD